jgi:transposase-like protein
MKSSRETTLEERVQIVKDCIESGYDYGSIAKKYDIWYQQVYTWVKKFNVKGNPGLQDRRGAVKWTKRRELLKKKLR